ncbi:substrate-binding domain-containing protein [uncultured Sphaerochaeta sp.]|uniref:substrate-binding domain-containing protein n=1 Tax=uncultured Sphaerochaeta sp. TaxID=886478 RepID=UPI002A0A7A2B|nr:substrate-binding domain-containing protein [uncultured Sphaerochaeta sp.]
MKKKLRIFSYALTMVFLLVVSSCSNGKTETTSENVVTSSTVESTTVSKGQEGPVGKYTPDELKGALIYIITDTQQNSYFVAEAEGAKAAAEAIGFQAKITSYESDITKETELCDMAIAEGAVAIIWDVTDSEASITSVQKAKDAGIPTFCTSRELNTTGVAVSQIVADNAGGSMAVAERFVQAVGEVGQYAELYGMEGDNNSKVRSESFHAVLDQYPDLECVAVEVSNFSLPESYSDTENILQSHPDIIGIVTANDTMALGAWQACVDAGKDDVVIIGVDGSDEVAASIKEGGILATALQPCVLETRMAVQQAYDFLTKGTTGLPEKQIVESPVIDSSNADRLSGFYLST